MNRFANDLFENNDGFKKNIKELARQQFRRRKSAYASESIFDVEDLEQEIWCAMFESNRLRETEDFLIFAEEHAERIADRGRYKNKKAYGPVETALSQLPEEQRLAMENLYYAGSEVDIE